jgi:hypothetical protein
MVKVDLSKFLPTSALRHLAALIPGLFFLISIALGNIQLAAQLSSELQFTFPFGQFALIFVALFLAFVIGSASINLVMLIQHLVRIAYKPYFLLRSWIREEVFLPYLNRRLSVAPPQPNSPQPKPKPRWLFELRGRTFQRIHSPEAFNRAIFEWWEALAEQLLRTRYGLKDENFPDVSRQPLIEVLPTATREELRGNLLVVALHATGWTALVASRLAPDLRFGWFYFFACFLIGIGLYHDFLVADYRMNPVHGATIRLRALLREFPKSEQQRLVKSAIEEEEEPADT